MVTGYTVCKHKQADNFLKTIFIAYLVLVKDNEWNSFTDLKQNKKKISNKIYKLKLYLYSRNSTSTPSIRKFFNSIKSTHRVVSFTVLMVIVVSKVFLNCF